MRIKSQTRLIHDAPPVTLRQLVVAVRAESRDDVEAAQVLNHLLLSQCVRFVEELDQEEIRLLHS
jgi:hypothetical protein